MEHTPRFILTDENQHPIDPIHGFETEYGLDCRASGDYSNEEANHEVAIAAQNLTNGQYLASGSRSYLDIDHPEFATVEQTDYNASPIDVLKGHLFMANIYKTAYEQLRLTRPDIGLDSMALYANTCTPQGTTWGNHLSILADRRLSEELFVPSLLALNVSRIVVTGCGHILPTRRGGFSYSLSERAEQLWALSGVQTVTDRPIVNLRDEALADATKYRRIHDIAADATMSPIVNGFRAFSLGLVIAATGIGASFRDLVPLKPIEAIKQISHDPSLQATVRLPDERQATALSLLRQVIHRAADRLEAAELITVQQRKWVIESNRLFDTLEHNPEDADRTLDWVIKRKLVDKELSKPNLRNASDYARAIKTSIGYHLVAPREGAGMQLIRKGWFEDAPSETTLQAEPELPQNNRALIRGNAIKRLHAGGFEFNGDWKLLQSRQQQDERIVLLGNPYNATSEQAEAFLDRMGV